MIGGNTKAVLQVKTATKNAIGEFVKSWHDVPVFMPGKKEPGLIGFLDLQSGDSKYNSYNAKIQESTHVFICDYVPVQDTFEIEGSAVRVDAENARMVANGKQYDVLLIDDPMELHKHLEFYLRFTGGQ